MNFFFAAFVSFFLTLAGAQQQHDGDYVIPDEAMVERVPYEDSDGYSLVGFVSTPSDVTGQVPALIFIQYVIRVSQQSFSWNVQ